ncbi:hypothetical protein HYQ46_007465 [Verticillium longisporum]|nr:hypothetical protein HYQ46_007465 [Verticillium longisporum]
MEGRRTRALRAAEAIGEAIGAVRLAFQLFSGGGERGVVSRSKLSAKVDQQQLPTGNPTGSRRAIRQSGTREGRRGAPA